MSDENVIELSRQLNAELAKTPPVEPAEPLGVGIHYNVPAQRYHRRTLGHVSKSGLDRFDRSPAHYKAWVEGLDKDTPALSFGRAFHCAVLEPDRFDAEYVEAPDFGDCRYKANKERRNEWRAEHAGKDWIESDEWAAIVGMRDAVFRHPLASKMIRDGRSEVTIAWEDQETGLFCRSRADYYVERLGMVLDVKSTEDASEDAFKRSVVKYRYHVQDALYRAGFAEVGALLQHFVLIAVEKTLPYAVATYSLDADAVARGYSAARTNIDYLAECVRKNHWPAYPERIQQIALPPWA